MSYELDLYFDDPVEPILGWRGWTGVSVDGPLLIDDEDIPPEHLSIVQGRRYVWQLHLPMTAQIFQHKEWLDEIVATHNAVLIDPQLETYQTAKKQANLPKSRPHAKQTLGELTVYFDNVGDIYPAKLPDILAAFSDFGPSVFPCATATMSHCNKNGTAANQE